MTPRQRAGVLLERWPGQSASRAAAAASLKERTEGRESKTDR
jgi:hypothetical protein